jgi:3-oxoacyl-[acyl-carrier-protein] synthase II
VVTGIGLWTGLGSDRESTWGALRSGRIAVRPLGPELVGSLGNELGCPLDGLERGPASPDPVLSVVERVAAEALRDAGLHFHEPIPSVDPARVATLIGLSKGCVGNLGRLAAGRGADVGLAPGFWERLCWPNAGALAVASAHGLRGPCLAPVAACATGLVAVLQGAELIRRGACDVALAGSADASLDPMLLAAFRRMGVLARLDGDPERAVRPWDRRRSGFVVGEGGALLVLERQSHARERGVLPYAEVAGGALGADAHHATSLDPDPAGLAALIGRALLDARTTPEEIDHVNVHGTATRLNDPLECRALRRAFGEAASGLSCSANKGQIGHLLGAAGAAELAIACLSIRDGFVPPTRNLDDPDPACDLDGTPNVGRSRPVRAALKLSIGFGGHLAAAVLRRPEGEAS